MKCSYCGIEIKKGTGTMYVRKNGDVSYFCSNRCYKNSIVLHKKLNKKIIINNGNKK
ncbi:MAG: 50S ribosomal protein L24e [Candidatus Micrarchaeia archaeon]